MSHPSPALFRILGGAHVFVAIILLPISTFLGLFAAPLVLAPLIWLAVLGVRLWWPNTRVMTLLRCTHIAAVPLAILLIVGGLFALRAAQRSAEAGGGLLGAFGLIPIVMGLLLGGLSVVSLCVSHSTRKSQ